MTTNFCFLHQFDGIPLSKIDEGEGRVDAEENGYISFFGMLSVKKHLTFDAV